eukprot:Rmarinus@m.10778
MSYLALQPREDTVSVQADPRYSCLFEKSIRKFNESNKKMYEYSFEGFLYPLGPKRFSLVVARNVALKVWITYALSEEEGSFDEETAKESALEGLWNSAREMSILLTQQMLNCFAVNFFFTTDELQALERCCAQCPEKTPP